MARQGQPPPEPAEETAQLDPAEDAGEDAVQDDTRGADAAPSERDPPELPPLESLDENSDYSAFMAADVAPDVRRHALRKLFQSAKFNVRDGLDDYDLDYSNPEPLGNIVTAEMRRRLMQQLERLAGGDEDGTEQAERVAMTDDTGDAVDAADAVEPGETQQEADADDERPATT